MTAGRGTPRIVVTPGEPAGIGPELVVKLAQREQEAELVAAADPMLLEQAARRLGAELTLRDFQPDAAPLPSPAGRLSVATVPLYAPVEPGQPTPANARYVLDALETAVTLCREGRTGALVTGPVHKGVINDAGIEFTGHTEFLAQCCGVADVVMMLVAESLRVALVTTHLPLAEVPRAVTPERVSSTLRITREALARDFGIESPRLLVLGLNPHAGEGGHLGREEIDTIAPVIEKLRAEGCDLRGPLPADTAFTPASLEGADAVVAMYHDQGLPVLKHAGFGHAVNITLGLPIVRTSVDHGTGLDIAGTGKADAGSLNEALNQALAIARRRAATA